MPNGSVPPRVLHSAPSHRASERGAVLILVAILAVLLIGFLGLAIDTAWVNSTTQQLQSAADAGALAATRVLRTEIDGSNPNNPFTNTRAAAVAIADANNAADAAVQIATNAGNAAGGDIVIGAWDSSAKTFTPNLTAPNAVEVTARRTAGSTGGALSLIFGGAFGAATSDVSRTAIASLQPSTDPYLLVLDASAANALSLTGNGNLDVRPGNVQVNSTSNSAIRLVGSTVMAGGVITTAGGASYPAGSITGTLVQHGATIADPLSGLLPDAAAWNALKAGMAQPLGANGKISSGGTYGPGYYPKGLSINSTNAVSLTPGAYMFGTGFSEGGLSSVNGTGVTIFLDQGANLSMSGGTNLILTPPSSGACKGLTLFSHRSNSSPSAVNLNGSGTIDIEGTLYVPGGTISMTGTTAEKVGQLICDQFSLKGTGIITGKNIVPASVPNAVYLVH